MTLWDAYQLANQRRFAVLVLLDGGKVRVQPRRDDGNILVSFRVTPEDAKAIEVERV